MQPNASISVDEARRSALELCRERDDESVAAEHAAGRYSAGPVWAHRPCPHYRASAMDGIALLAADTAGAGAGTLSFTEVGAGNGRPPGIERPACPVDTGQLVPDWADAVVRIEDTSLVEGAYEIGRAVVPGRDIRGRGEDIKEGELLFSGGHLVSAADIGAMLATGIMALRVVRRPRIALITTGAEIIEPDREPAAGEIVEFNSRMMAAMVDAWGGHAIRMDATGGSDTALGATIDKALASSDLVCVIAGSSVGRKDSTIQLLSARGRLLVHGINLMPGRPAALANIGGQPVLAVPGYPVSAAIVCRELLYPMIIRMLGGPARGPAGTRSLRAVTRRKLPSKTGTEELVRVRLTVWNGEKVAVPLARGAGSIGSLSRADALLRIGAGAQGIDAGTEVDVELLADPAYIEAAVTVAGRCPLALVELAETLRRGNLDLAGFHLAHLPMSDHDALRALEAGEAHFAVVAGGDTESCQDGLDTYRLACPDRDLRVLALAAVRTLALPRALATLLEEAGGQVPSGTDPEPLAS